MIHDSQKIYYTRKQTATKANSAQSAVAFNTLQQKALRQQQKREEKKLIWNYLQTAICWQTKFRLAIFVEGKKKKQIQCRDTYSPAAE